MSVSEIDVDQLAGVMPSGPNVIDVREPDEYVAGHVPGAVLVPLATVPDSLGLFSAEGPTYLICLSGARSMRAAEYAAEAGFEVVNVAGGTKAWIESGRDVVTGDSPA